MKQQPRIQPASEFFSKVWWFVSLRPYGENMMTPAVRRWLFFSWLIIFLMSLLEATVWAAVSQYFVPQGVRWLEPLIAVLFFVGIFVVIWVVDVSFITSEKPVPRQNTAEAKNPGRYGQSMWAWRNNEKIPWWSGVALRLAIILISVLITAPFLTQVIRSDEITRKYKELIDQERQNKESEQVRLLEEEIRDLRDQRQRLEQERSLRIEEREEIEQRAGEDQRSLREQIEGYRQAYDDEIEGRGGKIAGYGPRARQAEQSRDNAQAALEQLRLSKNQQLDEIQKLTQKISDEIAVIDRQSRMLSSRIVERKTEISNLSDDDFVEEYSSDIPANNLGTRVRLLQELRDEEKQSMGSTTFLDHFKSVEGLSQALLGILFLSLLALKFFEPKAVQLYFNEALQHQWRRYQTGEFDEPGFEPYSEQASPFAFADAYQRFITDPDEFYRDNSEHLKARENLQNVEQKVAVANQQRSRIAKEALDEELAQQKQFIKAKYEEKLRLYQEETAAKLKIFQDERKVRLQELELKAQNLEKRNQERAKRVEILELEKQAAIERERVKIQREEIKGERDRKDWERRREHEQLRQQRAGLWARVERRKQQIGETEERLATVQARNDAVEEQLRDVKARLEQETNQNTVMKNRLDNAILGIKRCENDLDTIMSGSDTHTPGALDEIIHSLRRFREAETDLRQRLTDREVSLDDLGKRLDGLREERDALVEQRQQLRQQLERYRADVEQAEEELVGFKWLDSQDVADVASIAPPAGEQSLELASESNGMTNTQNA